MKQLNGAFMVSDGKFDVSISQGIIPKINPHGTNQITYLPLFDIALFHSVSSNKFGSIVI